MSGETETGFARFRRRGQPEPVWPRNEYHSMFPDPNATDPANRPVSLRNTTMGRMIGYIMKEDEGTITLEPTREGGIVHIGAETRQADRSNYNFLCGLIKGLAKRHSSPQDDQLDFRLRQYPDPVGERYELEFIARKIKE